MEDNAPVSSEPKVLGKRAAEPKKVAHVKIPPVRAPTKKRDQKEESKDEPVRRSTRAIAYKPIYDEKEIAKLIAADESGKPSGKDDGAINVMLA